MNQRLKNKHIICCTTSELRPLLLWAWMVLIMGFNCIPYIIDVCWLIACRVLLPWLPQEAGHGVGAAWNIKERRLYRCWQNVGQGESRNADHKLPYWHPHWHPIFMYWNPPNMYYYSLAQVLHILLVCWSNISKLRSNDLQRNICNWHTYFKSLGIYNMCFPFKQMVFIFI